MNSKLYLWVSRGCIAIGIFLLVFAWNNARTARDGLTRELELEKIEKGKLLAERDASKRDLNAKEKELLANDADFKAEKDRLNKLLDEKPKVVEVIKWQTKIVEVQVPVEVARPCPEATPDGKPAKKIILIEGDTGHVEIAEATYETRNGNHVVLGKGTCVRDTPSRAVLFSSVIDAPLSKAEGLADPSQPRWGAGVFGALAKDGWAVGPKLMFPPLSAWSMRAEAEAGVAFGPTGAFVLQAGFGVRW